MSRADAWLGMASKAADNALIISNKPTSITVVRGATTLAPQTVRIEEQRGQRQVQTAAGQTYQINALVFGIKDHAVLADTDLQPGDRFAAGDVRYEVIMLAPQTVGSLQAYCRVIA